MAQAATKTQLDSSTSGLDPQEAAALQALQDTLNKALITSTKGSQIMAEYNTAIKVVTGGGQHG